MRLVTAALVAMVLALISPVTSLAQSPQSTTSVPRVINISGVFRPADGQPPSRVEVVTLWIYAAESGGAPVWQETQSIEVDPSGRYSLLLGVTEANGVPVDVFASGEARWLGMGWARPGEVEGPRTRLTSVPYALRASDAETLGGRPASSYALAPTAGSEGTISTGSTPGAGAAPAAVIAPSVVNPGTSNYLAKYVNASDVGSSAVYETAGAVGINTTTPFDILHSRFTNSNGALTGIAVQNLADTATSYSGMLFYDHNGALGQFQGFNNSTHEYRINNIATFMGFPGVFDGSINFMIGSTSRFFVNSNGGIGIGTTAPETALELVKDNGYGDILTTSYADAGSSSFIDGRHARGSAAAPSALLSGDLLVSFGARGYTGIGFARRAHISMYAAENWSNVAQGTDIRFSTTANGSTFFAERMRIDDSGNIGVGITGPLDRLHVAGDIRVGTGTTGCVKDADATVIAGVCASDARFKKDVAPFGPVLRSLAALQPVHYSWRAAEFPDRHFGTARTYGLIAQDVEAVLPELVVTDEDGYKAVNYSKLPLLTIQAVKELKAEGDAVKSRVEELKAENDSLKDRVVELERLVKELLSTAARR